LIFLRSRESLFLNARLVDNVDVTHSRGEVAFLAPGDSRIIQRSLDVVTHGDGIRCDEDQFGVARFSEKEGEGTRRASEAKVANKCDFETVDGAKFVMNRIEIEQGLCRVLPRAIAAVNDGDR